MNKKKFIEKYYINGKFDYKSETERALNDLFLTLEDVFIKEESINFIGWGKFEVTTKAPREVKNFSDGKKIQIPSKKSIKFKAGKRLKDTVNA